MAFLWKIFLCNYASRFWSFSDWTKQVNDSNVKICRMPSKLFCILKSNEPLTLERKHTDFKALVLCFLNERKTVRYRRAKAKRNISSRSIKIVGKHERNCFRENLLCSFDMFDTQSHFFQHYFGLSPEILVLINCYTKLSTLI